MEPTAHFNRVEHPCRASRSLTVSIPYFSPGSSLTLSLFLSLCLTLTRSPNLSLPFILTISRFLNILLSSLSHTHTLSLSLSLSCILLPGVPTNSSTPQKRKTRGMYYSFALCVCAAEEPKVRHTRKLPRKRLVQVVSV